MVRTALKKRSLFIYDYSAFRQFSVDTVTKISGYTSVAERILFPGKKGKVIILARAVPGHWCPGNCIGCSEAETERFKLDRRELGPSRRHSKETSGSSVQH